MAKMLVATTLLAAWKQAEAWSSYKSQIPNGDKVMYDGSIWSGVGHNSRGGGGSRNTFGSDFSNAGSWTTALCQKDSDGDGVTNGQELGDPICVWSVGQQPFQTTSITHPGFKDLTLVAAHTMPKTTDKATTTVPKTTVKATTTMPKTTVKATTTVPKTTVKATTTVPKTTVKATTTAPKTTAKATTTAPKTTAKASTTAPKTTAKVSTTAPKTTAKASTTAPRTTAKATTTALKTTTMRARRAAEETASKVNSDIHL